MHDWQSVTLPYTLLPTGYTDAMALGSVMYAPKGHYASKSTDGGLTWNDFSNFFAGSLQSVFPTKDGILLVSSLGTIYRSTDNGENWAQVFQTSDQPNSYVTTRAWAQNSTGTIFAGEYGPNKCQYLWKSVDDRENWTRIDYFFDNYATVIHIHVVFVDPETDRLYVSIGDAVRKTFYSDNEGEDWTEIFAAYSNGFTGITSNASARFFIDDLNPGSNRIWKSTDDSALTLIYNPPQLKYDTQPGGIVVDSNGDLWATTSNEQQTTGYATLLYSPDAGVTWRMIMSAPAGGYQFRMPVKDWTGRVPAALGYFVCTCVQGQQMLRIALP